MSKYSTLGDLEEKTPRDKFINDFIEEQLEEENLSINDVNRKLEEGYKVENGSSNNTTNLIIELEQEEVSNQQRYELMNLVIQYGARPTNHTSLSSLKKAIAFEMRPEILDLLRKYGAKIQNSSTSPFNSLESAIRSGYDDSTLDVLIEGGADPSLLPSNSPRRDEMVERKEDLHRHKKKQIRDIKAVNEVSKNMFDIIGLPEEIAYEIRKFLAPKEIVKQGQKKSFATIEESNKREIGNKQDRKDTSLKRKLFTEDEKENGDKSNKKKKTTPRYMKPTYSSMAKSVKKKENLKSKETIKTKRGKTTKPKTVNRESKREQKHIENSETKEPRIPNYMKPTASSKAKSVKRRKRRKPSTKVSSARINQRVSNEISSNV